LEVPQVAAVPPQTVYFDQLAGLFQTFAADTDCIYRSWLTAAVPDLAGQPGSRAVDLGCGTGRFMGLLAARHNDVLAVDISDAALDIARAEHTAPHVRFARRGLLDVTPAADGLFHTVLTVNTIHHLRAHPVALPHLRCLLAPGGHLVVVDLTDPGGWADRDWHVHNAFTDAEDSYRNRSQDPDVAADVLRLRLHPAWLEHATTDIPLSRADFHAAYAQQFPGAEFADLNPVITAVYWRAPT
jgi:SAM-dependent methyltransferase